MPMDVPFQPHIYDGFKSQDVLSYRGSAVHRVAAALGDPEGTTLSPERLIATGQAACLLGALQLATAGLDEPLQAEASAFDREGDGDSSVIDPAHLLAAGYAACFMGAMQSVAAQWGAKIPKNGTVMAVVDHALHAAEGPVLSVRIEVLLPGLRRNVAEELVGQAHQICPYTQTDPARVDVRLEAA